MIGIVTGLAAEARCCSGMLVRCKGPGAERAAIACEALVAHGVTGLVSFGLAGGLAPTLRPGTVVLASEVVLRDGHRLKPHGPWRERLHRRLAALRPVDVPVAVSDQVATSPTLKRRLLTVTGAGAVDMESGAVALHAMAYGLPFVVVRVTADPAERLLPPAALASMGPDGHLRFWRVLRGLCRQPWQGPAFVRLVQDSRTAFTMLRCVAKRAGVDFAFS